MNTLNVRKPIRVHESLAHPARLDYSAVDALLDDEDADLMLEDASLSEVEFEYIGDELTAQSECALFEAISTTRTALARSMRAFTRRLNQALSGADITAVSGSDDETQVGGVEISKVRKVAGIPILIARVPLSDGQSISLVFHSPTSNGKTIQGNDTITVFRFLLNKRDVTHVVAPQNGNDISLNQVCMLLGRLISINSPKFQRQMSIAKRTRDALAATEADASSLEQQQDALATQVDQGVLDMQNLNEASNTAQDRLTKAAAVTARLETERNDLLATLEALKATAVQVSHVTHPQAAYAEGYRQAAAGNELTPPDGIDAELALVWAQGHAAYTAQRDAWMEKHGDLGGFLPDPNPVMPGDGHGEKQDDEPIDRMNEGDKNKELTDHAIDEQERDQQQRDEENDDHADHTSAFFWYGLRTRGAGPGAVPDGVGATLNVEETAELEIVKKKGFDESSYKYGSVGYPQALTQKDIDNYSLTDFANELTRASAATEVAELERFFEKTVRELANYDLDDIYTEFFRPRSPRRQEVPIRNAAGEYDAKRLLNAMAMVYPDKRSDKVFEEWFDKYSQPEQPDKNEFLSDGYKTMVSWVHKLRLREAQRLVENGSPEFDYKEWLRDYMKPDSVNIKEMPYRDEEGRPDLIGLGKLLQKEFGDGSAGITKGLQQIWKDAAPSESEFAAARDVLRFLADLFFWSSDDINENRDKLAQVDEAEKTLISLGIDYGDAINSVITGRDELTKKIEELTNSQRDLDTGAKPSTIIPYPYPTDFEGVESSVMAAMDSRVQFLQTRLEMALRELGQGTIATMNESLSDSFDIFQQQHKDATGPEIASARSYMQSINVRLRDAATEEIQARKQLLAADRAGWAAERDKRRAEFAAGKPARDAAEAQYKEHKATVEELIEFTATTTAEVRAASARLRAAIVWLRENGRDAPLKDEIDMAAYSISKAATDIAKGAM